MPSFFGLGLVLLFVLTYVPFSHSIINLNEPKYEQTLIYKCPVQPDPMRPKEVDQSILIFKNKTIADLIRTQSSIILSSQSSLFHEISFSTNLDEFTFSYASMASLDYIFAYADINNITQQPAVLHGQFGLLKEEPLDDQTYKEFKALSSDTTSGYHEIDAADNKQIYKCIGNTITKQAMNASYNLYTSYIMVNSTVLTSNYSIGDIIFGNESFGFLETVTSVDGITTSDGSTKQIVQTKLTHCGIELNLINNMASIDQFDAKSSELDCLADTESSLYIVSSNLKNGLVGKVIIGRQSASFEMRIISKQHIGEYVVYEGITVNQLTQFQKKIDINKHYSYTFSKKYSYDATLQGIVIFDSIFAKHKSIRILNDKRFSSYYSECFF